MIIHVFNGGGLRQLGPFIPLDQWLVLSTSTRFVGLNTLAHSTLVGVGVDLGIAAIVVVEVLMNVQTYIDVVVRTTTVSSGIGLE